MRIEPVACKGSVVCAYDNYHTAVVYVQLASGYWLSVCGEQVPSAAHQRLADADRDAAREGVRDED